MDSVDKSTKTNPLEELDEELSSISSEELEEKSISSDVERLTAINDKRLTTPIRGVDRSNPSKFKRDINKVGDNPQLTDIPYYKDRTGIEDVDEILNLKAFHLGPESPLIRAYGCNRCWMRGTDDCPFEIKDGETHANKHCDMAIRMNLMMMRMMRSATGLKHIRNVNIVQMQSMLQHYILKLNKLRKSDRFTREEAVMLSMLKDMQKNLGERLDKAVQQEEGLMVRHETEFKPSDLANLLSKAKVIDIEKEAEIVDDDKHGL